MQTPAPIISARPVERIAANLGRQHRALVLLAELMAEEFELLSTSKPREVTALELSVQELVRQVAVERAEVKRLLIGLLPELGQKARVRDLTDRIGDDQAEVRGHIEQAMADIRRAEQACAVQSEKNYRIALALYDQNKEMVEQIQNQVAPKRNDVYGRNARYRQNGRMHASLVSGRL